MRMSASIFDNLRQPGIYDCLKEATGGDVGKMSQTVLARLRLDDLLTRASLDLESRLVWSITDVVDGRLFTLFPPEELKGISFQIFCRPSLAREQPERIIPNLLRSWLQDEDGNGRPGGFLAADESKYRAVAEGIAKRRGLDIQTIAAAREVAHGAGIEGEDLERLVTLWDRWHHAFLDKTVIPTGWGDPASAEPLLSQLLQKYEQNGTIPALGLSEVGAELFHRALAYLQEAQGRRDAPVKFLLDQLSTLADSDLDECRAVYRHFQHFTFSAIAASNRAVPEFTARVAEQDIGLSSEELDRVEPSEEVSQQLKLHPGVVSALGAISPEEYATIKPRVQSRIRAGIEEFVETKASESSKLQNALDFLAKEIGGTATYANSRAFRRIALTVGVGALGAFAGGALEIVWEAVGIPHSREPLREAGRAAAGAAVGTAVGAAAGKAWAKVDHRLLTKSLVRCVQSDLLRRQD